MQQLNDYFKANKSSIISILNRTNNASELVQAVTVELDKLIGKGSKFDDGLTPREQRLVTSFFSPLINAFYLLYKTDVKVELPPIQHNNTKNNSHNHAESLAAVLVSTIAATLAPGVGAALLAGLVSGGVAVFATNQISSGKPKTNFDEPTKNLFSLHLKPEEIQNCIKLAVDNFDRIAIEIEDIRQEALQTNLSKPVSLENMTSILEFFQEMLGFQQNSNLPEDLKNYLPRAQRILNRNGIDVVQYQHGVNDELFDRQTNFGNKIDVPHLIKPALTKEGKILLKGVVILPEN